MSVTYGFYNSINGDRKYNALEMSSIFDGIIVDGVYMSIGDALAVNQSSGMTVTIGEGRAWFDHTWTLNDSPYPITLDASDVLLNRIDAIVLEVNANTTVRANSFKIVKGTPATNPAKPTMIKGELLNQHPLAYITVGKGVTSITQANIENAIGTSDCPYVTGVLKGMDIDNLVAQWGVQWAEWLSSNTDAWEAFMSDNTNEWKSFMAKNKDEWSDLINGNTSEFETWFEHMKDQLSEDAAGNLQLQVDNLNNAALGGDFVLKGSSVSVEYMGANRIASITAYGDNAQGGTTEAPVPITGVESVVMFGQRAPVNLAKPRASESNGISVIPNADGSVTAKGTATTNIWPRLVEVNIPSAIIAGDTTISLSSPASVKMQFQITKPDGTSENYGLSAGSTSITVKIKSGYVGMHIFLSLLPDQTIDETFHIMITQGTEPVPFVPYVEPSITQLPIPRPLRRVGDVRDVCVTRQEYEGTKKLVVTYNVGFVELDGTEAWNWNSSGAWAYISTFLLNNKTGIAPACSHYQGTGAVMPAANQVAINEAGSLIIKDPAWQSVDDAKTYIASQKAAGTPVQIAYQLAAPEVYATDPVDFDNASGPLTVMTGGEVRVEISDGLSNLEQEIDKKAPIDHASSNTTYGTGNATKFGHLKLSDSTVSGSNADAGVAATPKAVNDVHAKANAAQSTANSAQSTANAAMPKAGGTFTGNVAARSANTAGAYIRNIRVQDGPGNQFNTNFIIMVRK